MIYLIDDKKRRQLDFGWTENKFSQYEDQLQPLYNIDDIRNIGDYLYDEENIILYHDSFLDFTNFRTEANEIRQRLLNTAQANNAFTVSLFSGSIGYRDLDENVAEIPASILYRNLELFIKNKKNKDFDIKYLLYGANPKIEQKLTEDLIEANRKIEDDPVEIPGRNLFIRPTSRGIQNAIKGAVEKKLSNRIITDEDLTKKIIEWLSEQEYDNIFIPICFGKTLSDFNGLRLATHIRCTSTPNQRKRIFIYSFTGLESLVNCEFFNILKTKDVHLVDHSKKAFQAAETTFTAMLENHDLHKELSKLKIDPPNNYNDHHSITNEWAIYQWAKTVGCDENDELLNVFQNVQSNLYFKYLRTINPIEKENKFSNQELKINHQDKLQKNPNVLLIDDEAEKGWYEIFCYILGDNNNISTDYLGFGFQNLEQEKIIERSLKKIKDNKIDIVILDFRLSKRDFDTNDDNISSLKLLEEIKKLNPGIQVIIFSATNKILNLQKMQIAGADGFIIKDVGQNIKQTIKYMIELVSRSIPKALWLKPLWNDTKTCLSHLDNLKRNHIVGRDFVGAIRTYLELSFDSLITEKSQYPYDTPFMYYFLILEGISKQIIDDDNPIEEDGKFKFQFRSGTLYLKHFDEKTLIRTKNDLKMDVKRIPYHQKFLNLIDYANIRNINPSELIKLRNNFYHPNLVENKRIAEIRKEDVRSLFKVCYQLIVNL